jgi:hypothetical protein
MTTTSDLERKLAGYRRFWDRTPVERPLIGFSVGGWFPFQHYRAMHAFRGRTGLDPQDLRPEAFLADYEGLVSGWAGIEDDMIRGISPLPFLPWLEAMLGCRVQVGQESVWAEEGVFDYAELGRIDFSDTNPWRRKYLEFVRVLREHFGDRLPVGLPILRGTADMVAALRGSEQMVYDLYDRPEDFRRLGEACTSLLVELMRAQHAITGPFAGGYVIEALGIWASERLARLQEDASALFSPDLYVACLQPHDWRAAEAFPCSLIHLHSSSLFLIDQILDVEALGCIQINKDVGEAAIPEMLPALQRVQARARSLLIRGKLDLDDLALLRRHLSPNGLYLQVVVETAAEARGLQEFFRPWV